MKTLGFIVNPIAGMGGSVGLKGTDGKSILEKARRLGAKPTSTMKAESFLSGLEPVKGRIRLITGAGRMGEDEARNHGFTFTAFGERKEETTPEDTKEVAKRIKDLGADLLVFCGGDGTARDILDSVGKDVPVLGVPTGVKMHSSVFAVGPLATSRIAMEFFWENLPLREVEVMDVDEQAFRKGLLSAKLYGYLLTPYTPSLIQGAKVESPMTEVEMYNQAAIAIYIIEEMKPNLIYIIGPGTTTRTIGDILDEKKTLLGVDIFCNKKLIAKDVNEKEILEKIKGNDAKIIVTPIGGQGFIFGRGNLQLSSIVIRQVGLKNIIIIATRQKMAELRCLRVDTGNYDLDDELRGYVKVITDYKQLQIVKIE
ncbi:MAG: ATP-NAD kinase family protein [Candidatus Methylarchaceae archaeon HK01M]|nr:ATP-NAD kinase family protein [Candidatus Methylarchaceae archaeon HK01M]